MRWLRPRQQLWNTRIRFRRFDVPLPYGCPVSFFFGQVFRYGYRTICDGVDLVFLSTDRTKGSPLVLSELITEHLRIAQPEQHLAHSVGVQQFVKEGGIQRRLFQQARQRLVRQPGQCPCQRLSCLIIGANGDIKTVQKAGHSPITAVGMQPERASILQLGQWL